VLIYRDGKIWKQVSESFGKNGGDWKPLVFGGVEAEELPPTSPSVYSQAVTNCVRVYVGDGKIRSAESARYFLTWIERLHKMTADPSLWRADAERAHVHRQFDEAAKVYEGRMAETR